MSPLLTIDRISIRAPLARVFEVAADIERWPRILAHYRWVRFLERDAAGGGGGATGGVVEMAAWRLFGPVRYPAWWVSRMTVDHAAGEIRYRHERGITRGMDVVWRVVARGPGTDVTVEHRWSGPPWPLVGGWIARGLIGPVFVHGIASRTLAGIKRHLERT